MIPMIAKPLKIVLKVLLALIIGIILSLAFFQDDPWIKGRFERMIKQSMQEITGVPFACKVSKVDLLSGMITATRMEAKATDGSWSFSCPLCVIRFSWLSWVKHTFFDVRLIFHKAELFSCYEQKHWAIVDPFIKLIRAPTALPIKLVQCSFKQSTVNLARDSFYLKFLVSSVSDVLADIVRTRIYASKGDVIRGKTVMAHHVAGNIDVDVPLDNPDNYSVKAQLSSDLPFVADLPCRSLLVYTYKVGIGAWHWYPEDRSVSMQADGITLNPDDTISLDVHIEGPLERIACYVPFLFLFLKIW